MLGGHRGGGVRLRLSLLRLGLPHRCLQLILGISTLRRWIGPPSRPTYLCDCLLFVLLTDFSFQLHPPSFGGLLSFPPLLLSDLLCRLLRLVPEPVSANNRLAVPKETLPQGRKIGEGLLDVDARELHPPVLDGQVGTQVLLNGCGGRIFSKLESFRYHAE